MTEQTQEADMVAVPDEAAAEAAQVAEGSDTVTVAGDLALRNVCEAALLAAGRPLTVEQIAELFDEAERPGAQQIRMALEALADDYAGRGIELREVATGFRVQVRPQSASIVARLWQERPAKYSRALLETLALIAYRQPITRGEIEDIRGVAVNPNIIRTLQERGWIRTVGYREVPGRPELLGTTREFLDYFGLKSLDNLPTLAQLRDVENLGVQLEFPETQATVVPAEPAALQEEASGEVITEQTAAEAAEDAPAAAAEDELAEAAEDAPGETAAVATAETVPANEMVANDIPADESPAVAPTVAEDPSLAESH
jgi:segregation and condensation protein B